MGLFSGISKAEIYERGRYFPPGFKGVVEVKKTIAKESRASGLGFIVETEVVKVMHEGTEGHELSPVKVGEKRTWWQGMKDKDIAGPALLVWAGAVAGFETHQKDEIEKHIAPTIEDELELATDNPADNDYVGSLLNLQTSHIITAKKKSDFTVHDWTPYDYDEEPETEGAGA